LIVALGCKPGSRAGVRESVSNTQIDLHLSAPALVQARDVSISEAIGPGMAVDPDKAVPDAKGFKGRLLNMLPWVPIASLDVADENWSCWRHLEPARGHDTDKDSYRKSRRGWERGGFDHDSEGIWRIR
jgi:hypothetical protein